MAGNVWQWCEDWYDPAYYASSPSDDPRGPLEAVKAARNRVKALRGGCWFDDPRRCKGAHRTPEYVIRCAGNCAGFRVVVEAPSDLAAAARTTVLRPPPARPETANQFPETLPKDKEMSLDLGGGVDMRFVLVPPGEFDMGSNDGPAEERPLHKAKISKPFYMGKYEVTVGQFRAFADTAKYQTEAEKYGKGRIWQDGKWQEVAGVDWRTPGFPQEDNCPVCMVTWNDAQEFCNWATKSTGRTLRLPTEAQWEYACRAGTSTQFNTGEKDSDLEQAAWFNRNSGMHTNAVGQRKANAWGLYDMHGNVWEWVQDYFGDKYYAESPPVDPQGPANGRDHLRRGGGWLHGPDFSRSAFRCLLNPDGRYTDVGFRCAVDVPTGAAPAALGVETRASPWVLLDTVSVTSPNGTTFVTKEDGSILAGGPNPAKDAYTVTTQTALKGITAVRIEALTDSSLVRNGPGRAPNGNFGLSKLVLLAGPAEGARTPAEVRLSGASTDYPRGAEGDRSVAAALDGDPESYWSVQGRWGQPITAVFTPAEPVGFAGGTRLVFRMLFETQWSSHSLGRFRFSCTTVFPPPRADGAQGLTPPERETVPAPPGESKTLWSASFDKEGDFSAVSFGTKESSQTPNGTGFSVKAAPNNSDYFLTKIELRPGVNLGNNSWVRVLCRLDGTTAICFHSSIGDAVYEKYVTNQPKNKWIVVAFRIAEYTKCITRAGAMPPGGARFNGTAIFGCKTGGNAVFYIKEFALGDGLMPEDPK